MHLIRQVNVCSCLVALFAVCTSAVAADMPARIVSLAPSITEMLFALELGDRVVGVSRFCTYPAAAQPLPRVGGFGDPHYEVIVALQPDLVVVLDSHRDAMRQLNALHLRTLMLPHQTIADIHTALAMIGRACGVQPAADALCAQLKCREAAIRRAVAGQARPRVLLCIERDLDSGQLAEVYVAGRNGFYDELIELAGGVNAYRDERVAYPQLSAEGIISLDPDVIVDLVRRVPPQRDIRQQWASLQTVGAVRRGRVYVAAGEHVLRPGPRYVRLLEGLAGMLHGGGIDHD